MNSSSIQTSSPLLSLTGRGFARSVAPVAAAAPAQSGSSWTAEDQAFGAALIREARREQEPPLYGEDARLRQPGREALVKQFGPGDPVSEANMSTEDKALLDRLRARDSMVRGHENAHVTAAGGQASGPVQYTYQTGPDGRQYAIGGSVNIAVVSSPADDDQAARQADTARRAAEAGGQTSLRDMQVSMRAAELSTRARSRGFEAYAAQAYAAQA